MNKGQIFSVDFAVSIVIFLIAIFIVNDIWVQIESNLSDEEVRINAYQTALTTSDLLIKSQGFPQDWSTSNVQALGLATEGHLLSASKILEMKSLTSVQIHDLLNLWDYSLYINLTDSGGRLLQYNDTALEIGNLPSDSTQNVNLQRIVVLDNSTDHQIANFNLVIWK